MTTSAEKMRAWTGPAILRIGFRPFFLLGAVWAALAMLFWIPMLAGRDLLPTAFDPVSWHAHEFLFGYLGAVAAGFLLTAVPNWTGRMPITGWPLAGLAALWLIGRIAVSVSAHLPPLAVALADLAFLVALAAAMGREIAAGRNWRNLPVLALVSALILGNALFHLEAARGGYPAQGFGLRLGLAVAVMLIALIGGRIVPSFTRNWLAARGDAARPAAFGPADRAALALTLAALALWAALPEHPVAGALCLLAGAANLWRLSRWSGLHTGAEALVWVLHAGYAFVPLGFLAVGAVALAPGALAAGVAQHVWMAGGIGLMTLAVMTRASLGHAGLPLTASRPVAALYLCVILSVAARVAAGVLPDQLWLLHLAGSLWIAAFGGFAALYWPVLTRPRRDRKKVS